MDIIAYFLVFSFETASQEQQKAKDILLSKVKTDYSHSFFKKCKYPINGQNNQDDHENDYKQGDGGLFVIEIFFFAHGNSYLTVSPNSDTIKTALITSNLFFLSMK
jgi:hypothetical protein